jgi:pyruvate/2-oxoglutarate dehydrogenase complex dihydrolipoamide acyltransferase (E2) component
MARRTFALPDLGEGLVEATVLEWLVAVGETVQRGAPLVEVETTKASTELPSPASGIVAQLHAPEGAVVAVGAPLFTLELADESGIVGTVPAEAQPSRRVRLRRPGAG